MRRRINRIMSWHCSGVEREKFPARGANTLDPGMLAKKLELVVMDFYLEPKLTLTFYLSGSNAASLLT